MIVDSAIGTATWEILRAIKGGFIDEHDELPDSVLQALHDLDDDTVEKAAGNADHLKRYWAHGAGAGKIAWGTEGDFARCVAHVGKYMDSPEGYCNLRHKEATGQYPSQHAAAQRKKKGVKKAVTLVEKFNPNHDGRGRFATHSGMRVGDTKDDAKAQANLLDDADTMAGLPEDMQAKVLESAASLGATPESLEANIEATFQRAVDRTGNPPRGTDWYEQANGQAKTVADDAGISHEAAVGMIAASSPQMAWAPNLAVARYLAENRDAPIDVDALTGTMMTKRVGSGPTARKETRSLYDWAKIEVGDRTIDKQTRVMPSADALRGKKASDLDPYVAAALLKGHAQAGLGVFEGKRLTGALAVADDISGKVSKVNFPGTVSTGRAMRIARGEDANGIINGHKVRSFRNNIMFPGKANTHDDVTVDSHAVSLALGRKISSSSDEYAAFTGSSRKGSKYVRGPVNATLGVAGDYPLWADAYRAVGRRHGLTASQVQSVTWIQWRHEHPDNARVAHAMD